MGGHPLQAGHVHAPAARKQSPRSQRCNLARSNESILLAEWLRVGIPELENAETFVKQLMRDGLITMDLSVHAALQGRRQELSIRSAQRHFLRTTGITHSTIRQIERARYATNLLKEGVSILDTVHKAGYYDQAHLTRSLSYLIGQTPAQIIRAEQQLSYLYKTGSR